MSKENQSLGVAMNSAQYAEEWLRDSTNYFDDGMYSWMAEQAGMHERVIEVGCGSGRSTQRLLKGCETVVCIEANMDMATMALEYLVSHGIDAVIVSNSKIDISARVTIFVTDIFGQTALDIIKQVKPSAILCWLIGAEPQRIAQRLEIDVSEFEGPEMPVYREQVHARCYELGTKCPDGACLIHIVDRLFLKAWKQRDEIRGYLLDLHTELSELQYQVSLDSIRLIRYQASKKAGVPIMSAVSGQDMIGVLGSVRAMRFAHPSHAG